MAKDADGMERYDAEWSIEGADRTRSGKLYGMHEQELANARGQRQAAGAARGHGHFPGQVSEDEGRGFGRALLMRHAGALP